MSSVRASDPLALITTHGFAKISQNLSSLLIVLRASGLNKLVGLGQPFHRSLDHLCHASLTILFNDGSVLKR